MRVFLLVTLMFLTSCITLPPAQQAALDECQAEADKATASNPDIMLGEINNYHIAMACMKQKGM